MQWKEDPKKQTEARRKKEWDRQTREKTERRTKIEMRQFLNMKP